MRSFTSRETAATWWRFQMGVENPFPITGMVTPREGGSYGARLDAPMEYLTESEDGDYYLLRAADRARGMYGNGVPVEVRFYGEDPGIPTDFEILGKYTVAASTLRQTFEEELSPTEKLTSNTRGILPAGGSRGEDVVLVKLSGFTREMADRLSGLDPVEDWHVHVSFSGGGVGIYVEVSDD